MIHSPLRTLGRIAFTAAAVLLVPAYSSGAQVPSTAPATTTTGPAQPLSLADALRLAESKNATLRIARAGLTRATGQQLQARSQYLPQVNGSLAYTRTLKSQFSALAGSSQPDTSFDAAYKSVCAPYIAPTATAAERQAALAAAESCRQTGGINFSKVGFGAANQWAAGLQLSQNVFTFGRIEGQARAANAQKASAEIEVTAQRAQLLLDVTQAYYNAALADRLVAIAESSFVQTQEVLRQTQLSRQVGNQSEFDLLRAQVTNANQLPVVIQARGNRDVAYLRLKQLLEMPLDADVSLTTPVDSAAANASTVVAAALPNAGGDMATAVDTAIADRAPVRQLEQAVRAQEGLVRAARSERWPQISLTSGYQRLYFPTTVFPQLSDFRENWTVGVSAGVSLFSGGRVRGDELVAEANLEQARAQLQQVRDYAALDARVALNQLQQAQAAYDASAGTAEQAAKAYGIDQIRYREGISTQTDLSQSRLLLEQATANRAVAARDLAVARMRLALLKDLPLQTGSTSGAQATAQNGSGSSSTQQTQSSQQSTQQRSATGTAGATGATGTPGGQTP